MTGYWQWRRTAAHEVFRAMRDLLLEHRLDYDTAYRLFQWPTFENFNWALEWFDVIAAGNGSPALILPDGRPVSFAEMSERSDAVACWLTSWGVGRGDRVMVALDQRQELWEVLLACMKIGAVVIPAYTGLTAAEVVDRVGRAQVRHVVCAARLVPMFGVCRVRARIAVGGSGRRAPGWIPYEESLAVRERFVPLGPTPAGSVAFAYFTSGTTSRPKLVAHTHVSYPVGHLSSMYWNGLVPGDRHLNVSAPGWAKHSWSSLFVPWNAEAAIVVPPEGAAPTDLPELMVRRGVTTFCAPPSTWHALLPFLPALPRPALREALSAGERLDSEVAEAVELAWGVRLRDGYGQTETTGLIGTTPGMPRRPGWLGRPLPGYRIGLRDRRTGTAGDLGEISVDLGPRPAGMMHGYLDGPPWLHDGWYGTGDLAERSSDGWIRVLGRRDEVFKSFDRRISPLELEAVLRTHPAVAAVAVVPLPDPVGGSVPHAVVEPAEGYRPSPVLARSILDHAAARLTEGLRPRSVEFVGRIPRTRSGKIRRAAVAPVREALSA